MQRRYLVYTVKPVIKASLLDPSTPYTRVALRTSVQLLKNENLHGKLRQESPEFKANLGFLSQDKKPLLCLRLPICHSHTYYIAGMCALVVGCLELPFFPFYGAWSLAFAKLVFSFIVMEGNFFFYT